MTVSKSRKEHIHGKVALLVDDDEAVLTVGQELLERLGLQVITATNGIEGLKIFQDNPDRIDVVISDIVMPEMGGEELYRKIRCIRKDIFVIFCSGYAEVCLAPDRKSIFLPKPYRAATLRLALVDALGPQSHHP